MCSLDHCDVMLCNTHGVTLCISDQVSAVVQSLEENLQLLCVTGVEDQLQVRLGAWTREGGRDEGGHVDH